MAFAIVSACIDVMDRSCIEVCPVDCIYEGGRKLYINPDECIDCAACEPVCPVEAITEADYAPAAEAAFVADNSVFFGTLLPGRDAPLGRPGGAQDVGPTGADTPLVAATVSDS
jgi:NAD-dependent dihydropyrimidine dehydrogenase PreA subunit